MDSLDLIIVILVAVAAVGGYRLGLLARAASWVGLAIGIVVAARLLGPAVRLFDEAEPTSRLLVAAGLLVGGAFLGQALGLIVGAQFHHALPPGPLRQVDRGLGAVAGLLGVLVAVWVILPSMRDVRGWPARQVRDSTIARAVDRWAPRPPDTLQALRRLVGDSQFPQVFNDLNRSQNVGPPPPASGLSEALSNQVAQSTVKVSGEACRRIQEGSGFAVGPGLIATNAHVVAGEKDTSVEGPGTGTMKARVVAFDPDRDLALLSVPGYDRPPIAIGDGKVGDTGAVYGHPGGQDALRIAPARISQKVTAVGRDLYDSHTTRRDVFILAADLHPGDSGGALVNPRGQVVGVAFAIAPDRPQTAYALTSAELRAVLAERSPAPVATGRCLTAA